MPTDASIDTAQTLLRPFTMADLEMFQEIAGQEEVLKWLIRCYGTNTREKIEKFTLAIELRSTGEIVGWCGLGPLEFDETQAEIYFLISREHWGQGLATEAAGALLRYAFDELHLRRVVAVVDPANRASVRVIEKLGMRRDRTVRGLSPGHGEYEGHALYSLGADDRVGMGKKPEQPA